MILKVFVAWPKASRPHKTHSSFAPVNTFDIAYSMTFVDVLRGRDVHEFNTIVN